MTTIYILCVKKNNLHSELVKKNKKIVHKKYQGIILFGHNATSLETHEHHNMEMKNNCKNKFLDVYHMLIVPSLGTIIICHSFNIYSKDVMS